jgi:hypothetical protein
MGWIVFYDIHPNSHRYHNKQSRDESGTKHGSVPETTDHFVKWINRRNVQKQFQRHGISQATSQCLYGSPSRHPDGKAASPIVTTEPTDHHYGQSPSSPSDSLIVVQDVYGDQGFDDDNDNGSGPERLRRKEFKEYGRWESIPNASQIELCMVLSCTDENTYATQPTSYNVVLVPSMDDRGIETTIYSGNDEDPLAVQSSSSQRFVT